MKPYYQDDAVTIYHADCRDILPELAADVVYTDPVWPYATVDIAGKENPQQLLMDALERLPADVKRLAVHLGCDSDPRFLSAVPRRWTFFRVCWLRYIRAHYKGRLLYNSDIAYFFGNPPVPSVGQFLIPGYTEDTSSNGKQADHPCPRKIAHAKWIVKWWSSEGETVLDPFLGSGTTAVAARETGRKCIGIEIEERYCQIAAKRCSQAVMDLNTEPLPDRNRQSALGV